MGAVWPLSAASVSGAGEEMTVPVRVVTGIGAPAAPTSVSARTAHCVTLTQANVSVHQDSGGSTVRSPVPPAHSEHPVGKGVSVGLEDPVTMPPESASARTVSQALTVRSPVRVAAALLGAPAKMGVSVEEKESVHAHQGGRVPCAHSAVQWAGTDPTVQRSVCATTEASVTLRQDSASAPGASQDTGVVRSVPWAALGRTVKVCVTVPMGPAAITLTEAVCVSLVSGARIAETECVHTGPLAFTVSSHVSVRTQTHSAAIR